MQATFFITVTRFLTLFVLTEPAKKSHSIACVTLFFDMRSYKIKSYVPEESFFNSKNSRFRNVAFENCFVVDVANRFRILSATRKEELIDISLSDAFSLSVADAASLLHLFELKDEFLLLLEDGDCNY